MVSDWGNGFLRKGLADDAITMFCLRNFPKSADVYPDLDNALTAKR